ncbi:MAG: hypothetical protein ACYDBQ_03695 [Thermoplasmatota archaeon]
MALSTDQLLAALGVVAVLIVGMVVAARARKRELPPAPSPWVGRYLQHDGDVVGQVVVADAERVVVQKGSKRYSFGRSRVREQGLDLGLTGDLDLEAAVEHAQVP